MRWMRLDRGHLQVFAEFFCDANEWDVALELWFFLWVGGLKGKREEQLMAPTCFLCVSGDKTPATRAPPS